MKLSIGAGLVTALGLLAAGPAQAQLNVVACEAHWASLAEAIGGPQVSVTRAVAPESDPAALAVSDDLTEAAADADLLLCTGAGLESAWLDKLSQDAGNEAIAPGADGRFLAAQVSKLLEDVSPEHALEDAGGPAHSHADVADNPHLHGDPRNVQRIAGHLARRLIQLDPEHKAGYGERANAFISELGKTIDQLQREAEPLRGVRIVVHSSNQLYLLTWLGLQAVTEIEPEPGTLHADEAVEHGRSLGARLVLQSAYEAREPAQQVAERLNLPLIVLPYTVGGTEQAGDLIGLYRDSVQRLLDGLKQHERS